MSSIYSNKLAAKASFLAGRFGGPLRWLLADEVWQFPGPRLAEEDLLARLGRLTDKDATKNAIPFQCRTDEQGFLLRYRPSFLGWHLIHRHFCFEGRVTQSAQGSRISGVFRFCGLIRGLQLGLLTLALVGGVLAMVPVALRLYTYGQTRDSDMLVMALAFVGATAAALGFFCFLSRLLKLAGNGARRALFRILADLEHS